MLGPLPLHTQGFRRVILPPQQPYYGLPPHTRGVRSPGRPTLSRAHSKGGGHPAVAGCPLLFVFIARLLLLDRFPEGLVLVVRVLRELLAVLLLSDDPLVYFPGDVIDLPALSLHSVSRFQL